MVGDGGQLLRGHAERRPGDADGRNRQALRVEHRNRDAAQTFFEFLVVDRVAAAACLFEFSRAGPPALAMVRVVSRSKRTRRRTSSARSGGRKARIALPTEVQCTGLLAPMRVIMRTERVGSILSM